MKRNEKSEILLFYARIFDEMGNPKKAISHLNKKKKEIVDHLAFNETLYKLHLKVNQND